MFCTLITNYYQKPLQIMRTVTTNLTSVSEENGIRRIVLNNPARRNALSLSMLKELKEKLTQNIGVVRCIILSGKGPAFSAGHDLSEMTTEKRRSHHKLIFAACTDVVTTITKLPIPVIAQVNGVAAAAGLQLAASCDIVIATEKSTFSTPGANVGLFCSTPGIAVCRAATKKVTSYMLLTGLPISAQEALQCGLISKICREDQLNEETDKIVDAICLKSRSVLSLGKRFYYNQIEQDVSLAYRDGQKVMVENLRFEDAQSGIKAFFEKSKPTWTHSDKKAH